LHTLRIAIQINTSPSSSGFLLADGGGLFEAWRGDGGRAGAGGERLRRRRGGRGRERRDGSESPAEEEQEEERHVSGSGT